jgi:PAS domain S-box-containing protein
MGFDIDSVYMEERREPMDSGDVVKTETGGEVQLASGLYERLVVGVTTHAIFMLSPAGEIQNWPPTASSIYGYDTEEMLGRTLEFLFADRDDMSADVDELLAEAREQPVESEHWHKRADSSVFWANVTVSPLENGHFVGYAAVCEDTTARKQYERMLERQNDRLKEFTDILSHDLRNPLNVIINRLELFRETGDHEHIDHIEATTERMERLIDDLLRVARQGDVVERPEPTKLEWVVETAWEGGGAPDGELEYIPVPTVSADADRLLELFENLFRNAREHGGERVSVRVGPLDDGFFVEDDGPGIPDGVRDQVFDHGFTTADGGSGFGLSVVRTIVGAHGWDVGVAESGLGGARFEISGMEFVDKSE